MKDFKDENLSSSVKAVLNEIDGKESPEKQKLPELSQEFTNFLACVDKFGARAKIWEDKKSTEWNIPRGCITHKVTDTNLVSFRPLTRRERRENFHVSIFK